MSAENAPNIVFCDRHNCTILTPTILGLGNKKRSEEVAESIVDVAQQIESSYDATIRTCLIRKKSHGPRNQVFFNICHLVASLKLTLKRGY